MKKGLLWGLVLWSALIGGCSLTTPRPEVRYYTLMLTVPEAHSGMAQTSLVVRPFTAHDPYNQERMVYRSSSYQLDFYNYHRWAASPAEQVTDWTRRYLTGAGLFAKVFPTSNGSADMALGGKVRQIEEIDHEQTWDAVLSVDFWLTRSDQHSPFWFQSYTATRQAAKRNPESITEALSRNLEDILRRLTADLMSVGAALPAS